MSHNTPSGDPSLVLSVIVPMHDAMSKMGRTIASLKELGSALAAEQLHHEVILVDDCSTDGTADALADQAEVESAWQVLSTSANSGSPSLPRNIGLDHARGTYVFFLDGDDEINPEGILQAIQLAVEEGHDLVRGPVKVHYLGDDRQVLVDELDVPEDASVETMLELIARHQSLNCSALWNTRLLTGNGLRFDVETRMGEDIVFTASAMSHAASIGYVPSPLFHYLRQPGGGGSSMHHFSGRELRELVTSWQEVEDRFVSRGMSYLDLHGDRTVNYALRLVFRYYQEEGITDDDVEFFCAFFQRNREQLSRIELVDPHVKDFVTAVSAAGAAVFWENVKPRLLIAGHDLKFIKPAVPYLRSWFTVRVDEWPTEITHDESKSSALLSWADFVWVEWMTSAALWYSERVRPTQNLVIRMHRYELGRSYADAVRREAIDAVVAIAPHVYEDFIERFDYDRSKVRFIPNYYMVDEYEVADRTDEDRIFRLAMIGAIPQRKGLVKGLELLKRLRDVDPRYTLDILGKRPEDLLWIGTDPHEQQYFAACANYVAENGLEDAVRWLGWSNTRESAKDYGFVLSMSEHEGSHVGPGEAYCAGNQGIFLRWRGAEFVYPEELVFDTIPEMVTHVLAMRDLDAFNEIAGSARTFMHDSYDITLFVERVRALIRDVG